MDHVEKILKFSCSKSCKTKINKSPEEVYESVNKVFDLILDNKLSENMDDSLLHQLLHVFSKTFCGTQRFETKEERLCAIHDFLTNTQALHLSEKAILSLKNQDTNLPVTVQCFGIELFGILFSSEGLFILYKESTILKEFSTAVRKASVLTSPSSIQASVLNCLKNLAKHPRGILWLNEEDLISFAFSYFTSYFVSISTSDFFERALFNWESSETSALSMEEQSTLNDILEKIVVDLIAVIKCDNEDRRNYVTYCMSALKICSKIPNVRRVIEKNSDVKVNISKYFQCLKKETDVNGEILSFISTVFESDGVSDFLLRDCINSLLAKSFFASAITLMGFILRVPGRYASISTKHIQLLIMPLQILSGNIAVSEDIFHLPLNKICDPMTKAIEVKKDFTKYVVSSLLALADVTQLMDLEALEIMMELIRVVATGPTASHHHHMSYFCLEIRQICLALIELLSAIINEKVYPLLKLQNKLDLFDYLLSYVEKPQDRNVRVEALKLMAHLMTLNGKFCISLPDELKEKIADLLCRKIMSKEEPIAIESLSVVGAILDGDENQFWKEIIFKKSIHQIVWEMGVDGVQSDMLKSSSLRTAFKVYKVPYFWEDIKSTKKVDEIAVLKILLYYFNDHGYYTQIEASTCIYELLADDKIPVPYLDYVFTVFVKSVDYCGNNTSIKIFDLWFELIKSSKYFPDAMQSTDNLLKAVCNSGFASALIRGLESGWKGSEKAAEILKKFREILLQMGYTKDSVALEDVKVIIPFKIKHPKRVLDPVEVAERKALVKKVCLLSTAEQIAMLAPPPKPAYSDISQEDIALQIVNLSYPVNSFLKCVWSDKVDSVLAGDIRTPEHLFSDFAWSVLDDIILSKGIEKSSNSDSDSSSDSSSYSDDWSKDGPDCY
ncbi:uncharacterized protein TNCT_88741 [Trichonephila clavata]|uniref:Uncharacterized protein n=1 Tax=Trichonephila clavata TaxID=2740835 RepID=A0A8X6FII3_TRICU|nr:uncharacterized protein TNCT_88741 [Trichonephila clavata]